MSSSRTLIVILTVLALVLVTVITEEPLSGYGERATVAGLVGYHLLKAGVVVVSALLRAAADTANAVILDASTQVA